MVNESELDDIRVRKDLIRLQRYLEEAAQVAYMIEHDSSAPRGIREAAFNVQREVRQLGFISASRSVEELRRRRLLPERKDDRRTGGITKGIIEFTEAVRKQPKEPKYQSAEFKCIADFDKCKEKRGNKNSALCHLALFICMGRRIIPFVRVK